MDCELGQQPWRVPGVDVDARRVENDRPRAGGRARRSSLARRVPPVADQGVRESPQRLETAAMEMPPATGIYAVSITIGAANGRTQTVCRSKRKALLSKARVSPVPRAGRHISR